MLFALQRLRDAGERERSIRQVGSVQTLVIGWPMTSDREGRSCTLVTAAASALRPKDEDVLADMSASLSELTITREDAPGAAV